MSGPPFRCPGRFQLGSGPGPEIAAAVGRIGRSCHEVAPEDNAGADLPPAAVDEAGQIALRRHLRHRPGTACSRPLQSCCRRPRSGTQDRNVFLEVAWIRLLGTVLGLLGPVHARSSRIRFSYIMIPLYSSCFRSAQNVHYSDR